MVENKDVEVQERVYPTVGQALILLLLLVLIMIAWGFIVGILCAALGLSEKDSTFINIVISTLSYGTILLYIFKAQGVSLERIIDKTRVKPTAYVKVFFLFLGYLFLLSVLNGIIQLLIPISDETLQMFESFLGGEFLLVLLAVCIIAPIAEETIFRGLILRGFLGNMKKWSAIFLSALLFGVLHLNIWQGISAFFLGSLLGWLYAETGSLKLVIFAHAANNFIAASLARMGSSFEIAETVEVLPSVWDYIYLTIVGLIIFSLSLVSLRKEKVFLTENGDNKQEPDISNNLEERDKEEFTNSFNGDNKEDLDKIEL